MIKRKAQVSQNCQDNKCQRSSQSTIIIHFAVAALEYSNDMGERFWRDYSIEMICDGPDNMGSVNLWQLDTIFWRTEDRITKNVRPQVLISLCHLKWHHPCEHWGFCSSRWLLRLVICSCWNGTRDTGMSSWRVSRGRSAVSIRGRSLVSLCSR